MKLLPLVDVMGERLEGVVTATEKLQKDPEYVDEQLKGVMHHEPSNAQIKADVPC
jgi:hypothetical protein